MRTIAVISLTCLTILFYWTCETGERPLTQAASGKVLVLAIDGGGIKGIIPAYVLTQLEAAMQDKKSYQLFDVIGGTSTGGIISIGLTTPFTSDGSPRTATDILNFYLQDCDSIFVKNHQTYSVWPHPPYGPAYYADSSGHGVEAFLQQKLSDTITLARARQMLPQPRVQQVFTTTYLVNSSGGVINDPTMGQDFGPYLFNWYDASRDASQNYLLWEAARATSAAPTYFPVAHVGGGQDGRSSADEKWSVDGGVMSNDPAVWAVAEALRTGIAADLNDIIVLSLGCGIDKASGGLGVTNEEVNTGIGQKYGFWGDATWVTPYGLEDLSGAAITSPALIETLLYANQFVPAAQLQLLSQHTGLQYIRVQVDLPEDLTPMDQCSNIDKLHTFTTHYFSQGQGQVLLDSVIQIIQSQP